MDLIQKGTKGQKDSRDVTDRLLFPREKKDPDAGIKTRCEHGKQFPVADEYHVVQKSGSEANPREETCQKKEQQGEQIIAFHGLFLSGETGVEIPEYECKGNGQYTDGEE